MIETLKKEIEAGGEQCRFVSIDRLHDLKGDLERFAVSEKLNSFQKHIINSMYAFEAPDIGFTPRSIVILAIPRPAYAKLEFEWQGRVCPAQCLARPYGGEDPAAVIIRRLKNHSAAKQYRIAGSPRLPLKRLAAAAGLAQYGRNNICCVEGMGSFLTLAALVTDLECGGDDWREMRCAAACASCRVCLQNCPTHAIRGDRFLIDNERCLSYFNEAPGEFPAWVPRSAHHCVYDCLRCQVGCPLNSRFAGNIIGPIRFQEAETQALLEGKPFGELDPALQSKARLLGMDDYLTVIPRNLKMLIEPAAAEGVKNE